MKVQDLGAKVINGALLNRDEALFLLDAPLDELHTAADKVTKHFFGNKLEMCSLTNGRVGRCSENCAFCAQSAKHHTGVEAQGLKDTDAFVADCRKNVKQGVHRFCIVSSGKRVSKPDLKRLAAAYQKMKDEKLEIKLCSSSGLLDYEDFVLLHQSGVTRIHNNLETSRRFFNQICTTHSYDDKLRSLQAARRAGMQICSGGIIGMGETAEDRVDLALELQKLDPDSVPVNILNPIKGTPLFGKVEPLTHDEICRTVGIFRMVLPHAVMRLAGGRILIREWYQELYTWGINALITGDMLTTCGLSVAHDLSDAVASRLRVTRIEAKSEQKLAAGA